MTNFKVSRIIDEKIWQLIYLFFYCSVPPILLVLTITLMYGTVNSKVVMSDFVIVLFQQSIPVFLCYGIVPCIFFKMIRKKALQQVGIRRNRRLWIDVCDLLVVILFVGYLVVAGIFQSEAWIWVIHYLFVAVSEEILVRGIILFELKGLLKRKWMAILASAVIFSLVFHSTDGTWVNVLYRIPFGLFTGILHEKTDSLMSAVLFHWIYDVLLSV